MDDPACVLSWPRAAGKMARDIGRDALKLLAGGRVEPDSVHSVVDRHPADRRGRGETNPSITIDVFSTAERKWATRFARPSIDGAALVARRPHQLPEASLPGRM